MRKVVLLTALGGLVLASVAIAAVVSNVYVINAAISPTASGTPVHPKPSKVRVTWDVSTAPAGERPANVRSYSISLEGFRESTTFFPGCGTSMLQSQGPNGCPGHSYIGGGYFIIEAGPPGNNTSIYNGECRVELSIYNGGNHNLSLFVYAGSARPGQPAPCPLPRHNTAINVTLAHTGQGISENFSIPYDLLHIFGTESAVVHGVLGIPKRSKVIKHRAGRTTTFHRIGLLETVACPPNHQRQVAITFNREDGFSDTRTTLVPCTP